MSSKFGSEIRRLRDLRGWSQDELAEKSGLKQPMIAKWETGKKESIKPENLQKLATPLGVTTAHLAQFLPAKSNARRAIAIELPILGIVGAGVARDEPAEPDSRLSVSGAFAGCVVYSVRGDSMLTDLIRDGDYLIVRPKADREPQHGDVVVAWIHEEHKDAPGHVAKKLHYSNRRKQKGNAWLMSGSKETNDAWDYELKEDDHIFGVLVGVVRVC